MGSIIKTELMQLDNSGSEQSVIGNINKARIAICQMVAKF